MLLLLYWDQEPCFSRKRITRNDAATTKQYRLYDMTLP